MRRSNNNGSENGSEIEAKEIILGEVQNVYDNPSDVRQDGCAACHVLFTLVDKMQLNRLIDKQSRLYDRVYSFGTITII